MKNIISYFRLNCNVFDEVFIFQRKWFNLSGSKIKLNPAEFVLLYNKRVGLKAYV